MHKIPGNLASIGGEYLTYDKNLDRAFTKHVIPLDTPVWVYVSSDGYRSQFSHITGKKFQAKNFYNLLLKIHQNPMDKQMEILQQTMNDWVKTGKLVDDILVIGTKIDLV